MAATASNVIPFRRSNRDFLQQAADEGRPLPLQVLLEDMWRLLDEADRLETTGEPEDLIVSRVARTMARRIAVDCAPYCHPKLSTTTVGGTDTPIRVEHRHFDGLSDERVGQLLSAVAAGGSLLELMGQTDEPD